MGQHGYSTSVRSQYPNSVSKNELSLYEELIVWMYVNFIY